MQLQKIISQLLFIVPYKAIPYWTGQKFKFHKKKLVQSRETHNIIPPFQNKKNNV